MRFSEIISEAGSPAQQAAIAIAMKKAGKKPKGMAEGWKGAIAGGLAGAKGGASLGAMAGGPVGAGIGGLVGGIGGAMVGNDWGNAKASPQDLQRDSFRVIPDLIDLIIKSLKNNNLNSGDKLVWKSIIKSDIPHLPDSIQDSLSELINDVSLEMSHWPSKNVDIQRTKNLISMLLNIKHIVEINKSKNVNNKIEPTLEQGVAEGSENNNTTAQKIFFARSNKAPKEWSYDHVGFITQDGKQIQMSGHKGNDVYVTNDVTDDPEFPKQNIKIVSLSKPVSVPTTNSVGAENCGTFVANVLQANGIKGIDTQKIYSVFKKPQEQGVAEGFSNTTFQTERKRLNVPALIKAGAILVTHPHSEQGWETDNKEDWAFSLLSLYNVLQGDWPSEAKKYLKPQSYKRAEQQINSSAPNLGSDKLVYDGKYNQILWSIKKLGIPDNVAFLDQQGVAEEKKPEFMKAGNMKPFKASGEEIPGAVHTLEKVLLKAKERDMELNYTNIDKMMQAVCKKHNLTGDELHNEFVSKHHMIPDDWIVKQLDENLHQWFKEKWVRFGPDGKIRGDCARGSESEGKPKCLPQSKAHSLGKKGRASAAARKRREDPNPDRSGKAINVSTKGKGK